MSRLFYSVVIAVVLVTSASFLTQVVQGGTQAAAQGNRPAAASSITPEQAAPFVANWLLTLSAGANDFSLAVAVTANAGKVAATVSSDTQPAVEVSDISMSGKSLVLKYITNMQGTPLSTVMTLIPAGARHAGRNGGDGRPVRDGRIRPRNRRRARLRPRAQAALAAAVAPRRTSPPTSRPSRPTPPRHAGRRSARVHAARRLPDGARRSRSRT